MQDNKQPDLTKLTQEQLEAQLETVLHFLKLVHPSLISDDVNKSCVEIRPIIRGEKTYSLTRSCNIWDLSEANIKRLRDFLKTHNGAPTCLFYSVFSYDNNMKAMTSTGKRAKPGKITTAAAVDTCEIALDFDHITFEQYTQLVDRFEEIGLYAMWVSTGHGYHAHILLKEALADKDILRQLVYKFRAKGFECDTACVDPARVMRLPGTFNKKYLKEADYADEAADPPRCEIYQEASEHYTIDKILSALDALPTVSPADEEIYLSRTKGKPTRSSKASKTGKSNSGETEMDVLKRIEYPYLAEYELPEAIQKMLAYTPKGYRNKCLGFMIKFLRTQFKFGKDKIEEILSVWAENACDPSYDPKEFKADFSRFYYVYNGLAYTPELARQFGPIDFGGLIDLRKKDISIPNKFFRSFADLDGTVVRLYLAIKLLEHEETLATQEALSKLLNISTRALRPTIQALEKSNFAYKVAGNKKQGIPFSYKTSSIVSKSDGYVVFSYNDIKAYITELHSTGNRANGALKLFLFFHYKFHTHDIYMSQENLGKHIGVAQNTISVMVQTLEELHFIKIRKVRRSIMESCEYTLLR